MDAYQGTHKRAYVNFRRAGKILLPIGIAVTAVFMVATVIFAILFGFAVASIDPNAATQSDALTAQIAVYTVLMTLSIVLFALGICALIPGIVFTALSAGLRRRDEGNGISYSEFDDPSLNQ